MILRPKNFKHSRLFNEYTTAPLMLKMFIRDFFHISKILGVDAVCVRIYGKHPGDSGVHLDERAADFRDEFRGSHLYTPEQVEIIKSLIKKTI